MDGVTRYATSGEVVDLQTWRRRHDPAALQIDAEAIRQAGAAAHRLARQRRLRALCDAVVEALVTSDHPLASDPAALMELMETLEALRAEARFQAEHPVGGG